MLKKLILTILILALTSCAAPIETTDGDETADDFFYQDDVISAKYVDPVFPHQFVSSSWMNPYRRPILEECDIVFKGILSNSREIKYTIPNYQERETVYATLYDFTISEIFYQTDNAKVGDVVIMYSSFSSRRRSSDVPAFHEGIDYIFFSNNLKLDEEIECISKIADYNMRFPAALIYKADDGGHTDRMVSVLSHPINNPGIDPTAYEDYLETAGMNANEIKEYRETMLGSSASEIRAEFDRQNTLITSARAQEVLSDDDFDIEEYIKSVVKNYTDYTQQKEAAHA